MPKRGPRNRRTSSPTLGTAKEHVRKILDTLPDDAPLEVIQYQIGVRQIIQQGWDDPAELQERVANWLTKWSSRTWPSAR
jgi:hypothetical protein